MKETKQCIQNHSTQLFVSLSLVKFLCSIKNLLLSTTGNPAVGGSVCTFFSGKGKQRTEGQKVSLEIVAEFCGVYLQAKFMHILSSVLTQFLKDWGLDQTPLVSQLRDPKSCIIRNSVSAVSASLCFCNSVSASSETLFLLKLCKLSSSSPAGLPRLQFGGEGDFSIISFCI